MSHLGHTNIIAGAQLMVGILSNHYRRPRVIHFYTSEYSRTYFQLSSKLFERKIYEKLKIYIIV